jgi:hypothetical protein
MPEAGALRARQAGWTENTQVRQSVPLREVDDTFHWLASHTRPAGPLWSAAGSAVAPE